MKSISKVLCVLLTALPVTAFAWSNHSLGTALALRDLPALKQAAAVQLEPLEDFLRSESAGLQALLDQQEAFALVNFPGYPERRNMPLSELDNGRTASFARGTARSERVFRLKPAHEARFRRYDR
ncbi:MAG: hypothetical protein K2X80_19675, partial [Pseudomonadaceae bacterium]|nr:hypothetical protein [Pseudomonadaceae bacterium]